MADLIVNFPNRGRRGSNSPAIWACCGSISTERKSVRFSHMVTVQSFDRCDAARTNQMWYSESDFEALRIANRRNSRDVHERFRSRSISCRSNGVPIDTDCVDVEECLKNGTLTGLERFLSEKIIKKTISSREGCYNAVLGEQNRQNLSGEYNPGRIRRASRRHTEWTRKRAYAVGLLNAQ